MTALPFNPPRIAGTGTWRSCLACGTTFLVQLVPAFDGKIRQEHRFCPPCRIAGAERRAARHREYFKQYNAAKRQEIRANRQPRAPIVCAWKKCGREFTPTDDYHLYCREKCEQAAAKRRTNDRKMAATRERLGDNFPCGWCGRGFARRTASHRFCRYECSYQYHYAKRCSVLIEPRARWRRSVA
jgi:hypothetical protein